MMKLFIIELVVSSLLGICCITAVDDYGSGSRCSFGLFVVVAKSCLSVLLLCGVAPANGYSANQNAEAFI
ncbi:hypothetical protein Nepgr_032325 [Nepenthes gracilis]|uniref:Uncharacterized protein n=1 Tax=Nepenthes gracilis TaxID=150966 RepID=A0AAD3TKM0_NEPGR|nr:hypothetical protein Nepgr_032325 [Nepenthes gracilis]